VHTLLFSFVQQGGFTALITIVIVWCGIFISRGLDAAAVPAIGTNFTSVLGVVVFNFAICTSIPSWVNEKKESVSIEKSFAVSMPMACTVFTCLGFLGAMAFPPNPTTGKSPLDGQTILVVMYGLGTKIAKITFFLFPACVNLTSIPVFSIMQRYNLVESGICGHRMALFIAVCVPWAVAIPLYTGKGYEMLVTWSGILITSVVNFVIPPVLYLLALNRTKEEAEKKALAKAEKPALTAGEGEGGTKLTAQALASIANGIPTSGDATPSTAIIPSGSTGANTTVSPQSNRSSARKTNTFAAAAMRAATAHRLARIDTNVLKEQQPKSEIELTGGTQPPNGTELNTTVPSNNTTGGSVTVDIPASRATSLGRRLSMLAHTATNMAKEAINKKRKKDRIAKALKEAKEARAARREAKKKERMKEPDEAELFQAPLVALDVWTIPPKAIRDKDSRIPSWLTVDRVRWVLLFPISLSLYYTVPHASSFTSRSMVPSAVLGVPVVSKFRLVLWVGLGCLMCLIWTAGLTYMMLWCANLFTDATTFHPFLLGVFVLGVGLRLPSFFMELRGYRVGTGDLNRVFLNSVLQIVLCVPVPWLIHHMLHHGQAVHLYSGDITVLSLSLFIMGSLVCIIFASSNWIADRKVITPILATAIFFYLEAGIVDYELLLGLKPECDPTAHE
jgi:hypothetical protein